MKIILDNNVPAGVVRMLPGHDVATCPEREWTELENGQLIAAAELAGFELMITADQNIRYQQNLAGRKIALLVLGSNYWPSVLRYSAAISSHAAAAAPGSYAFVEMLVRRRL